MMPRWYVGGGIYYRCEGRLKQRPSPRALRRWQVVLPRAGLVVKSFFLRRNAEALAVRLRNRHLGYLTRTGERVDVSDRKARP